MSKTHISLTIIAAFLAGIAGAWVFSIKPTDQADVIVAAPIKETSYDRVMRTQTIRCGYAVWPPSLIKEPNTGKLSGIMYDYTEALGQALHLKIDWTEEVGWGDFPAALNSGRIDAMCGGVWPNSERARVIDSTQPIYYQPINLYARADDHRFDNNLSAVNEPSTTLVVVEGSTPGVIAAHDFSKAKVIDLPQLTPMSDIFVNVVAGKADLTLTQPSLAVEYNTSNPGKIRRVDLKMPLRIFGVSLAIGGGQDRFRRMLDAATNELISSGQVEQILQSYNPLSSLFLRVAAPYQSETENH